MAASSPFFGHPIPECIVRQDDARNDHHAMSILGPQQAPLVNDPRVGRIPQLGKKVSIHRGSHTGLPYSAIQKSGQFWVRAPTCRDWRKKAQKPRQNASAMSGDVESQQQTVVEIPWVVSSIFVDE